MQQVESSRTSSSWRAQAVFPPTVRAAQATSELTWGPAALEQRRQRTREHLAKIAPRREGWIKRNSYYYELLGRLLRFLVEPQKQGAVGSLWHRQPFSRRRTKWRERHRYLRRDSGHRATTESIPQFRSRFPGQGRVPTGIQAR